MGPSECKLFWIQKRVKTGWIRSTYSFDYIYANHCVSIQQNLPLWIKFKFNSKSSISQTESGLLNEENCHDIVSDALL